MKAHTMDPLSSLACIIQFLFNALFGVHRNGPCYEGVDRGDGGTGIEGAELGVEGAESGVKGAGSGSRGGGKRGICGRGSGKIGGRNCFFTRKFIKNDS